MYINFLMTWFRQKRLRISNPKWSPWFNNITSFTQIKNKRRLRLKKKRKITPNSVLTRHWTKSISWSFAHSMHWVGSSVLGGCLQGAPKRNLSFEIFPFRASTANFFRSSNALSIAGFTTVILNEVKWTNEAPLNAHSKETKKVIKNRQINA